MADFAWQAINAAGEPVRGTFHAASVAAVQKHLRAQKLTPVRIVDAADDQAVLQEERNLETGRGLEAGVRAGTTVDRQGDRHRDGFVGTLRQRSHQATSIPVATGPKHDHAVTIWAGGGAGTDRVGDVHFIESALDEVDK